MAGIVLIAFALLSVWSVAGFVVAVAVGRAFANGNRPADGGAPNTAERLALTR